MVASAGGLDAFKRFFQAMPPASGIAFVLIPHLDPRRESLMAELLAKQTAMPVAEATEGVSIEPDHVYVLPPNKYLTVREGELHLSGPVERTGPQTSIDSFLRSLAEDQQEKAICIVLSGTGSHGSLGLKAIKAGGGMAMVQDPVTAEYDRMPQSAIATGLADYVLPAERMPEALVKYVQHFFAGAGAGPEAGSAPDDITQILALLRARSKFDFRSYRSRMLVRRIRRRMGLAQIDALGEYLELLRQRPEEVKQLSKDLLISVTSFFRDPEMYQVLEAQAIPELLRGKPADALLRVWVPGCATGEEAYSIAMVLIEQIAAAQVSCALQVFATDVDADALEVARRGVYPDTVATDVSPERIARFFGKADEHSFQVSKQLRETVLFAQQDLLSDAPFSRLDLVSCRNLLIYLEQEVQLKVLLLLHFALNDGGLLVLGPSETVGHDVGLFEPLSKKWRIYRRSGAQRRERVDFPIAGSARRAGPPVGVVRERRVPLVELTQQALLDQYAPAAVVIDHNYEVLYFHGPTSLYLQQPAGTPTHELIALAAPGLRSRIRAVVHKAMREEQPISMGGAHTRRSGRYVAVRVSARPLHAPPSASGLVLVTFEDEAPPQEGAAGSQFEHADESLARQMEYELKTTREELQSTIEELESSNEELKASNEEVMSMNEELQSANEELETSKEELQSLNEELSTVNSQLQDKVVELESASDDMANLLNSADIPTVFLGADLRIKRFTPAATRLFNLIVSDVGRPIGDLTARCADPALQADMAAVLQDLSPRETEVLSEDGRWYIRRILPYRTRDNRIEGLVVAFNEVTQVKQGEQALRQLAGELEQRVADRTEQLQCEIRERMRAEEEARQRHAELAHVHRVYTAGELATALAHELNQPLAAIGSFAEASLRRLQRGVVAKEFLADNLRQIGAQAERAAAVIRELRAFLAKNNSVRSASDVNVLVRTACTLVESGLRGQGVRIDLDLAPSLPPVMAERIHIEHVLVNLLRNGAEAIRDAAMQDGRIVVRTRHDGDALVRVTVEDSGPGLDAEGTKRVFEPFYTTKAQGLGMGLCISRTVIESHGGKIWAQAGTGGIFHFTLPLAR